MTIDSVTPHYVRFAQALALATTVALPACGASGDPSREPAVEASPEVSETARAAQGGSSSAQPEARVASSTRRTTEARASVASASPSSSTASGLDAALAAEAASSAPAAVASSADDAGAAPPHPHTSGPLAPPELPLGLA